MCSGSPSGSSSQVSSPGDWLCSRMSDRSSSSEDDSSSNSPLSSDTFVVSEGRLRCCSSVGDGLGVSLLPGVVPVERLLTKNPLLSLPSSEMVTVVLGDFRG
jgi:hypothetical protein